MTRQTSDHILTRVKELVKVQGQLAPGITLVSADNLKTWLMDIQVMDANPIYQGEIYRLRFEFSSNYPIGIYTLSPLVTPIFSLNTPSQNPQKSSLSATQIALSPSTLISTQTASSV